MAERQARLATLATVLLLLPAILGALVPGPTSAASGNPWFLRTVATDRQAIYDMAVGEVDANGPGNEIILTGGGGLVNEFVADTFQSKTLYALLKTQIAVAVGDVQSGYAGNEVISVGTDHMVHVLHRAAGGTWAAEMAWESVGSVNGVTVGEFNASHPGKEIAVAGDKALMAIITEDRAQSNGWSVVIMPVQYVPLTNMMCYSADILPDSPGDEVFVGSFGGQVFLARRWANNMTWNITSIWTDDFAILGVGTGATLVPGLTGPVVYIAGFGGRLTMLHYNGTDWTNETIFTEKGNNPLYAVVPYDIDPRYPGPELIVGGIGYNLHIVRYFDGNWTREDVIDPSGQNRLRLIYDLEVGEFDKTHPGPEIILGGMLQDLLLLEYIEPSFELVPMPAEQMVVSGHDAHFWLFIDAVGYFSGTIALSADAGTTLSKAIALPGDMVVVTVHTTPSTAERSLKVNVTGTSLQFSLNRTATLNIDALPSSEPGMEIDITPEVQYTVPSFSTTFVIKPTFINGWSGLVEYDMNTTMPLDQSHIGRASNDINEPAVASLTPSARMGSGSYPVLIEFLGWEASSARFFRAQAVAVVNVDASGAKDFSLSSFPQEARGVPNSTVRFDLSLSPLPDFPDQVVLSVDGLPAGSKGSFSAMLVTLPTKVYFTLEVGPTTPKAYHILAFHASGSGKDHSAGVIVAVLDPASAGDFRLSVLPAVQMARPGGTANFLVRTTGAIAPDTIKVEASGPFQAAIQAGKDGNPEYHPMVVTVTTSARPGVYRGTVVGSSDWEHNASFTVIVSTDLQEPDLALVPKDLLVSPGQDWPTFHLDAVVNRDLIVGKDLRYTTYGLGGPPSYYTVHSYNYSRTLSLPLPELKEATYLFLIVFYLPNNTYGKALFGTVTMTAPVALLHMHVDHEAWTPREGAANGLQVIVVNDGPAPAYGVTVEVLLDGKTVDRKTLVFMPARDESGPLDFRWTADSGKHNLTVIMYVENETSDGRIMDKPHTTTFEIYPWNLEGPAIAMFLIILAVGMLAATTMGRRAGPKSPRRIHTKGDEEE